MLHTLLQQMVFQVSLQQLPMQLHLLCSRALTLAQVFLTKCLYKALLCTSMLSQMAMVLLGTNLTLQQVQALANSQPSTSLKSAANIA